jgi:hypothetical protein
MSDAVGLAESADAGTRKLAAAIHKKIAAGACLIIDLISFSKDFIMFFKCFLLDINAETIHTVLWGLRKYGLVRR